MTEFDICYVYVCRFAESELHQNCCTQDSEPNNGGKNVLLEIRCGYDLKKNARLEHKMAKITNDNYSGKIILMFIRVN